jgi:hypothetical protein
MAVNTSRSMNVELRNGRLDGVVRSAQPNHSGARERLAVAAREGLAVDIYGPTGRELDMFRASYPLSDDDIR